MADDAANRDADPASGENFPTPSVASAPAEVMRPDEAAAPAEVLLADGAAAPAAAVRPDEVSPPDEVAAGDEVSPSSLLTSEEPSFEPEARRLPLRAEALPPAAAWSPLRRGLTLGVAFLAPMAVIAASLYFIVKGGAPRELPARAPTVASAQPAEAPEPNADAAPEASNDAPSLEQPMGAEVAVPGFEDDGNEESPKPGKPAPPKHFGTVQEAAAGSCSTESVDGLSRQVIEQARCIKPNDFVALPKRKNLAMAAHVYPYLEVAARDHLVRALDAHSATTMTINSCLRTVVQQYLVSRWAVTKTCGVQLATPPGESNHEIGTALDIEEAAKWRPALEAEEFRWLGASDRVHFDYKGASGPPHTATDVLAFQKLWNRNHKEDPIGENGRYDAPTEQRLKKSPPGGFPIGASCAKAPPRPR